MSEEPDSRPEDEPEKLPDGEEDRNEASGGRDDAPPDNPAAPATHEQPAPRRRRIRTILYTIQAKVAAWYNRIRHHRPRIRDSAQVLFISVLLGLLVHLYEVDSVEVAFYGVDLGSLSKIVAAVLASITLLFNLLRPFPFLEVVDQDDEGCFYLVIEPRLERTFHLATATV